MCEAIDTHRNDDPIIHRALRYRIIECLTQRLLASVRENIRTRERNTTFFPLRAQACFCAKVKQNDCQFLSGQIGSLADYFGSSGKINNYHGALGEKVHKNSACM